MREYRVEINVLCLEAQTLTKKRLSFKVFIVPESLFSNNSIHFSQICISYDMYCDGSITIMWSLNIFINDFPLLAGE